MCVKSKLFNTLHSFSPYRFETDNCRGKKILNLFKQIHKKHNAQSQSGVSFD